MTATSTPPAFPRHVVTAVLVAHDGARWLPGALAGLLGQDRPVQRILAVDTGSGDDSPRLLAEAFGEQGVLHLARRTGFGAAVDQAVRAATPLRPEQLPYRLDGVYDADTGEWHPSADHAAAGYTYAADPQQPPAGPPPGPAGPAGPAGDLSAAAPQQPGAPRTRPLDGTAPIEWIWLLHDDCEPQPDALRHLLAVAENGDGLTGPAPDATPGAAGPGVIGPKLRGWYDRRQLLEVGTSIARSGRRWTALERREQDQGQHDGVRPVLSVSSAGMLVRRDVWEHLDGFDRALPMMRDDADFGWRANAAGHQVLVAPDAVLRHAEASARERRRMHAASGGPHRTDKAGAAYTLLVNTRGRDLPWTVLRLLLGTVLRTLGYLLAKVPGQAVDEILGLAAVALTPHRIIAGRRRRARNGAAGADPAALKQLFPKPGATALFTIEQLFGDISRRSEPATTSARHSTAESGPTDEGSDFLQENEKFPRLRRLVRRPGPLLLLGLLLLALLAFRGVLGSGTLQGGALLPAPGDAAALWSRLTESWHALGTGGTDTAPPYLAVPAALGTLLFGDPGLAVDVLMVAAVPLGGFLAYLVARPLVPSRSIRIWLGTAYALAPAVTAGLADGRLGIAVLTVLLPLIARTAASTIGWRNLGRRAETAASAGTSEAPHAGNWRSAWLAALLLATATAFVPAIWLITAITLLLAVAWVTVSSRRDLSGTDAQKSGSTGPALPLRALAVIAVPILLLAPWSLSLFGSPSRFLGQAGLPLPFSDDGDLLGPLLSPGGDGVPPGLVLAGVLLAALAALLRADRLRAVLGCWLAVAVAAVIGLWAANTGTSGAGSLASDGAAGHAWNGGIVLICTAGLLAAAAIGAEGARQRVSGSTFGWRQPAAVLIAATAALAPVVCAGWWAVAGADDPLVRRSAEQVPPFVAEESTTTDQARTLVLRAPSDDTEPVDYVLIRGSGLHLGDAELTLAAGQNTVLDTTVRDLVAGTGGDQPQRLASFAARYVVARPPIDPELTRILDTTPGLTRLSQEDGTALWRNDRTAARLTLRSPGDGKPKVLPSGPTDSRTRIPSGPDGRILQLADRADPGWTATLDGRPLKKQTIDGWAQGFQVPAAGGTLELSRDVPLSHTAWLWTRGALLLVLVVLALPGRRTPDDEEDPAADPEPAPVPLGAPGGRRSRRLAAAAAVAQVPDGAGGVGAPSGTNPPPGTAGSPAGDPGGAPAATPFPAQAQPREPGQDFGQDYDQDPGHLPGQQVTDGWYGSSDPEHTAATPAQQQVAPSWAEQGLPETGVTVPEQLQLQQPSPSDEPFSAFGGPLTPSDPADPGQPWTPTADPTATQHTGPEAWFDGRTPAEPVQPPEPDYNTQGDDWYGNTPYPPAESYPPEGYAPESYPTAENFPPTESFPPQQPYQQPYSDGGGYDRTTTYIDPSYLPRQSSEPEGFPVDGTRTEDESAADGTDRTGDSEDAGGPGARTPQHPWSDR
jgi:GT2 family glycosyltransferase